MAAAELILGLAFALGGAAPSGDGHVYPELPAIYERAVANRGDSSRLWNVFAKAERGEPIVVGVIGGSITAGTAASKWQYQWGAQTASWWRKTFPNTKIDYVNAGIGATGTDLASHRINQQLLVKKPDIVGVEFSVNDGGGKKATERMEGVVRQILMQPQTPAVYLLHMMNQSGYNVQQDHLPVARHYGLQAMSYRDALWPCLQAKTLIWKDLSPDTIHPHDMGHTYAAALVNQYLQNEYEAFVKAGKKAPQPQALPDKPLIGTCFDHGEIVDLNTLKIISNKGFELFKDKQYLMGMRATEPGSKLVFEIDGPTAGIAFLRSKKPMGHTQVTVDGKVVAKLECWFDQWWYYTPYQQLFREQPGRHVVEFEVLNEKNAGSEGYGFEMNALMRAW